MGQDGGARPMDLPSRIEVESAVASAACQARAKPSYVACARKQGRGGASKVEEPADAKILPAAPSMAVRVRGRTEVHEGEIDRGVARTGEAWRGRERKGK